MNLICVTFHIGRQSFINNEFTGFIPIKKLSISYATSSGPGGQNVNRVQTKVSVKFNLEQAEWIPEQVRARFADLVCFDSFFVVHNFDSTAFLRLVRKHKNSINKEGYFMVKSDKTRQQSLNIADCLDKLRCYLTEAAQPTHLEPSAETLEQVRQRRERASIRRLQAKKHRSMLNMQKQIDY